MTAKEYLSQYKWLDKKIQDLLDEKSRLEAIACKVTSDTSNGSGHGSSISDKVGSTAAKLADIEREIDREIDRLVDIKQEIKKTIATVPNDTMRALLTKKYINLKSFEQIAEEMGYSKRHVLRLHEKALIAVEKRCH